MIKGRKVGVGLITCDRLEYFIQSFNALLDNSSDVDEIVVVNDGEFNDEIKKIIKDKNDKRILYINNVPKRRGVGFSKNQALKRLILLDCGFLFLIENDILIKRSEVFGAYVQAANKSGIWHMNFHAHGPANRSPKGDSMPRHSASYGDGVDIGFYPHCVGAFSFYIKSHLEICGLLDENYKNAWEHVDHTYTLIKKGLHTPFWWFADLENSTDYLEEIEGSISNSSISHTDEWMEGMRKGRGYFAKKHGYDPVNIPDTNLIKVRFNVGYLQEKYSNKL